MSIQQLFVRCTHTLGRMLLLAASVVPAFSQTLDHFDFSTIGSPHQAYVPFRIILTAKSSTGATVRTFTGTVELSANSAAGALIAEAFTTMQFTSGQWVGTVAVNQPGDDVTLTVRDPASGRTGTSAVFQVEAPKFRVIDSFPVISLASDPTRGVLYASAGPISGGLAEIHFVDPTSAKIVGNQFILGGVGRLEISHDWSKLYVVTDDETVVRRFRLPDFVQEAVLNMGEADPGMLNRVDDIAVHPTNPNIVAITKSRRELSPRFTGVSVFEDTVEKKTASAFVSSANAVDWGVQPNRLYGLDNETTPAEFIHYDVTASNITAVASRQNTLNPFNGQIQFLNGKLYCSTGRIIDPETFTILGELANGNSDALMLPLPDQKRIIYLTPSSLGFMLIYDADTLQLVASEPFPTPRGRGSGVVSWGNNGIAFHDGRRLFLRESPWIPSDAFADVEVTAVTSQGAPLGIGVDQEMHATVRNLGPNNAGEVNIKVTGTPDAILTDGSVTGINADVTVDPRVITFQLAALDAGASVTVNFTAHSNVEAWEPFSIIASGPAVDPNSSNNAALVVLKAAPQLSPAAPLLFRMGATASVADKTRGTLIIAPTSLLAPSGNSVVTINPISGEISQPALVGPRPSQLAVSDDGKYLYVGFRGVPEVRRFLLPAVKHDLTIPLGFDNWRGPRFPSQIELRPGHAQDIIVARFNATATDLPADLFGFFRNGVEVTPDRGYPQNVHFVGAERILAHEEGWGVSRFDVTDNGLNWVSIMSDIQEYGGYPFIHDSGKLYFADGQTFNADTGAQLGAFFTFGPYITAPIIDQPSDRALFVQRTTTNFVVAAFDTKSFTQVASNTISITPTAVGSPTSFTRWSGDGLAFSGSGGIAIIKTDLVSAGPAELRIESVTLSGPTVTLRFPNLSPGQYIIEQSDDPGASWSQLGDTFTETTSEIPISSSATRKFYRLVKLQ